MHQPINRPLEYYNKAFMVYSGAQPGEYELKADGLVLASHDGETYRICHYDDLIWEFKTYFDDDFSLIYTELPFELWTAMFEDHNELTDENLSIDIFEAYRLYWENENRQYKNKETLRSHKQQSYDDFLKLVDKLRSGPDNIVKNAAGIDDMTLIPILALAMRMQFKDEEDFYRACVDILIEELPETFSDTGFFEEVSIETAKGQETFYIYETEYDFEDSEEDEI